MVNFFGRLSIGKKLYVGFASVLVVFIAITALSMFNVHRQNETTQWNYHTYNVLLELEKMLTSMVNMETGMRGFMITGLEASLEPYYDGKETFQEHYDAARELTADNPRQQQLLAELYTVHQEWMTLAESAIAVVREAGQGVMSSDESFSEESSDAGKEIFDRFRSILAQSVGIEQELLAERIEQNENRIKATDTSLMIGTIIGVLLALVIAFAITRTITRAVNEVKTAAEALAEGNLDIEVKVRSNDEIGVLAQAFRRMADNFNELLASIQTSSEQVFSGSRMLSDSSVTISQGATEQASAVEELTSTMEQIGAQTNLNAERAVKANQLAVSVQEQAMAGNEQMQEMLRSMEEINEASSNISKIIKVIDEIAFQTNLLALNAAVEAARAGQHGKGFAVVAEEVRNLAARSASAAKETTELIEGSIKKAENGSEIANKTAAALNEIVEGVTKVAELVDEIAAASQEQSTGIEQVNQAIGQVAEVTQTNSAISEETASASEELSSQAEMLLEQVRRFKLKDIGTSSADNNVQEVSGEINERLSPQDI